MKHVRITTFAALLLFASGVQADIDNGLVAYYPFNANAADESGHGFDGTVYGATPTTDRFGASNSAYHFNGVDNYIQVDNFALGNAMTVSLWAYTESGSSFRHFIGSERRFALWYADGLYNWITGNGVQWSAGPYVYRHDTTPMNEWFHIAGVYDGSEWRVYINGVLDATVPAENNSIGTFSFTIGDRYDGWPANNHFFKGSLDEVRIYNRALPQTDIEILFSGANDNDGDGFYDLVDDCDDTNPFINPYAYEIPGNVTDENCDGDIGECDPCNDWKNHGKYVRCVSHAVEDLVSAEIISEEEGDEIVSSGARSDIGKKGFVPEGCPIE